MSISDAAARNVLLALAGGDVERAAHLVREDLPGQPGAELADLLSAAPDASRAARTLGDWVRAEDGPGWLTNEAYRVCFYRGNWWRQAAQSPMARYFFANRAGRPLDKWPHYFPIYERHLSRFVGTAARVLEIGVFRGGGLDLLADYLGEDITLVGMDIDAHAAELADERFSVFIGDQSDPDHLLALHDQYGPFDCVIDDGGHTIDQQITSAEVLFPLLNDGGTYLIEDVHTSYWPEFLDRGDFTLLDWVRDRLDDLNAHHHSRSRELSVWQTHLRSVSVYDSVVVLDKGDSHPPFSEVVGTKDFVTVGRLDASREIEVLASRDAALRQRDRAHALMTQAQASAAQAMSHIDDVRRQEAEARAEALELATEVRELSTELEEARALIDKLHESRSWRVTAPLRRLGKSEE